MRRFAESFRLRGDLWSNGDFLRLWAAQSISQVGSQVSQLALPLVAILALEATAFEVALLAALEFLPFLLFALPAGVWVDRLPRRPILILADVGRAVALASVPVAAVFDVITIWQLYAVGFAVGTLTVAFDVAYQPYLPALIGRRQLVDGNSKLELSRSVAQIGGPGLGGLLVAALTAPYAVAVDAVSFIVSAIFLRRIRTPEPPLERPEETSWRLELTEGLRYLFGDPRWRAFSAYVATINFFSSGLVFSILLVFAVRELGLSAAEIGLILAVSNTGSLAAALGAGRISRRLGVGPTLILAGILSGVPLLFLPLATPEHAVSLLLAPLLLEAFAIVLFNITGISYIQAVVPDRILGRMTASRRFVVWGTIPLGAVAGGALAATIGLRETILVGAVGSTFCFLFLLVSPFRSIRDTPVIEVDAAVGRSS
jgi:MFS family permease